MRREHAAASATLLTIRSLGAEVHSLFTHILLPKLTKRDTARGSGGGVVCVCVFGNYRIKCGRLIALLCELRNEAATAAQKQHDCNAPNSSRSTNAPESDDAARMAFVNCYRFIILGENLVKLN